MLVIENPAVWSVFKHKDSKRVFINGWEDRVRLISRVPVLPDSLRFIWRRARAWREFGTHR